MAATDVISYLQDYAMFAGPLIFVVAAMGATVGTNCFVPAGMILNSAGVLVGSGVIPWTIILWAWAGAAIGLSASYTIGLLIGPHVREMRIVKNRPEMFEKASSLFGRYGQASILVAAFSGPLRAAVACIAAMAGMPRLRYELASIASALIWAVAATTVGALPGLLIARDSYWILIAPVAVPVVIMASALVVGLRMKAGR